MNSQQIFCMLMISFQTANIKASDNTNDFLVNVEKIIYARFMYKASNEINCCSLFIERLLLQTAYHY